MLVGAAIDMAAGVVSAGLAGPSAPSGSARRSHLAQPPPVRVGQLPRCAKRGPAARASPGDDAASAPGPLVSSQTPTTVRSRAPAPARNMPVPSVLEGQRPDLEGHRVTAPHTATTATATTATRTSSPRTIICDSSRASGLVRGPNGQSSPRRRRPSGCDRLHRSDLSGGPRGERRAAASRPACPAGCCRCRTSATARTTGNPRHTRMRRSPPAWP